MKRILIANWKMNHSFDEAENWLLAMNQKLLNYKIEKLPEIVICPPAIILDYMDELLMDNELERLSTIHHDLESMDEKELEKLITDKRIINLGGQDCSVEISGAFTGDISAKMLHDAGCEYVILGHSERRSYHNETNEIVAKKISAAVGQKLTPILCVGESKELRQNNNYADFILTQIENSIPKNLEIPKLLIAYEPIWSIGSGLVPTLDQIEEVTLLIKNKTSQNKLIKNTHILYGGSVKKENNQEILSVKNIDGLLVGGASLNSAEFFEMIKSSFNN